MKRRVVYAPLLDAVTAPAATVRPSYGLLAFGDRRVLTRAERGDLQEVQPNMAW